MRPIDSKGEAPEHDYGVPTYRLDSDTRIENAKRKSEQIYMDKLKLRTFQAHKAEFI